MNEREFRTILITVMTVFLAGIAAADSVQSLVLEGNALYDKGNFNEALKQYDQALLDQPQAAEPKFNKADCYFRMDDLDKAIELYNDVAVNSKDMALVAKAKYNLGNCRFQQGMRQKDSNLQKAMEDLQNSIVYWRSALEIDAKNENAAKNIEVARLMIKDIIDQINKQQQQQQEQAQKQKQLQDHLKELAEQQKALAQKTQQTKDQAEQGQVSPQEAQDSYKQQAQEQSQLQSKTQQTMQQLQQQQQDPNNPQSSQIQQVNDELKQATDAQSNAQKQLENSKGDAAKKSEDKAVEHIENALKSLSQNDQQNQQQRQAQQDQQQKDQAQQQQAQQSEESKPSDEQQQQQQKEQEAAAADVTAQEILDKEQQEKEQRQLLQQGGYQNVEKDW